MRTVISELLIEFFLAIYDMVIAIAETSALIYLFVLESTYIYSAGLFSAVILAIAHIFLALLINIMEQIIQNTLKIHTQALQYVLDNIDNPALLHVIHAYLTPYIKRDDLLFNTIQRTVIYLEGIDSSLFNRVIGRVNRRFNFFPNE